MRHFFCSTKPSNNQSQEENPDDIGVELGKNMSKILDSILKGYDARTRPFPNNGKLLPRYAGGRSQEVTGLLVFIFSRFI